jgi:hypothetical protein
MDGSTIVVVAAVALALLLLLFRKKTGAQQVEQFAGASAPPSSVNLAAGGADAVAIPPAAGDAAVHSTSEPGTTYQVDLATLTCSCEDHRKRRRQSPDRDVRRCCKHIGALLLERGIVRAEHELLQLILTAEHGTGGALTILRVLEHPVVFSTSTTGEWSNVWTRGRKSKGRPGRYQRYGWNEAEQRWSYGKAPPGAAKIVAALGKAIR